MRYVSLDEPENRDDHNAVCSACHWPLIQTPAALMIAISRPLPSAAQMWLSFARL
jgi:hypothetical protein